GELKLFTGTANPRLGASVAEQLGVPLGNVDIHRFRCGEIYVRYLETVRGDDVFVIQPFAAPVNESLVEMLIMIDTLKRASADRITAVVPYYGYARQEKKDAPREPISARMVADVLTTVGANRVVVIDLHAPAIQGFFNIPVDHLTALPMFVDYCRARRISNGIVIAPDAGRVKTAERLASRLDMPVGVVYKRRPSHNVSEVTHVIGEVEGKTCIIIEDIIDTGGSVVNVVEALLKGGARPEVLVCATHAVLSSDAPVRLSHPAIAELVVTDTVPIPEDRMLDKISVLSVAPLIAEAIRRIHGNVSISALFN
ncbi:MAG: ribose-phosphate pyrophosphokinase, partial [Bacillota bacterium]